MPTSNNRLRIVVLGYVIRGPLGGMAWHHLQYVLGLVDLGHEVMFLEESDDYPSCYDPQRDTLDVDPSYGIRFAANAFTRLGIPDLWAYYDAHSSRWHGPAQERVLDFCDSAEVLLNISGVNPLRSWSQKIGQRILIDTDPGFTQIRHLTDPSSRRQAAQHTGFFTFGENFGEPKCRIPDDGFSWRSTRQPIVSRFWPRTDGNPRARITTVMQWDSYASASYQDLHLGMKSASFQPFFGLPARCDETFELALGGRTAPRAELAAAGWRLLDSRQPTLDPWTYQSYLQQSKAEFGIAKHGYVCTSSGWFSERTAAYLASGRPVLAHDTGFRRWLDADRGVLPFSNCDDLRAAICDLNVNYAIHCAAAREVAVEYFEASKVLGSLLERIHYGSSRAVSEDYAGMRPIRLQNQS